MSETKTVSSALDLYLKQTEDVANMRSSLLSFNRSDPLSAKMAIQNVTVLRVYHQLSRIVRYTEMMDKIEDKIYQAIDCQLMDMDEYDPVTIGKLLTIQERLQKCMIESHKLLEPYLDLDALTVVDMPQPADCSNTFAAMILDQESREKLRTSAQQVLSALSEEENDTK